MTLGAFAGDATAADDELEPPPPVVRLNRIPPRTSYELGVQMVVADMPQFREDAVPIWPGIGIRAGWGRNVALHRVGFGGAFSVEGPAPEFYTLALEPFGAWDYVANSGFALGGSIGPTLLIHNQLDLIGVRTAVAIAPTVAMRIGWSQTWSRVGKRLHFYIEPKVRFDSGGYITPVATFVIGSGRGR